MKINPKVQLAIGIIGGIFAIAFHFPPYDFILCFVFGLIMGDAIRKLK